MTYLEVAKVLNVASMSPAPPSIYKNPVPPKLVLSQHYIHTSSSSFYVI